MSARRGPSGGTEAAAVMDAIEASLLGGWQAARTPGLPAAPRADQDRSPPRAGSRRIPRRTAPAIPARAGLSLLKKIWLIWLPPRALFVRMTQPEEDRMTSVTIYRPSKTAMQSGVRNTQRWVLEFDSVDNKFVEPLMGWTGSADTSGQLRLRFESRDAAVAFAERHGLSYRIREPKVRRVRPKSYAENFAYDRRME